MGEVSEASDLPGCKQMHPALLSSSRQGAGPSPRRSPRIRRAYDGVRMGSVERASKRKAATSDPGSGSGGSATRRSSSSAARRKKAKVGAGLLELSLAATPAPLTRGKIKLLAEQCDLNATAIFDEVQARATSSGAVASSATSSSYASSVCVLDYTYV